jgi:hypothetical protein
MNANEPARFLDNTWPLAVVLLPPVMGMTAIRSIVDGYDALVRRNQRFAHVVDCSAVSKFPGGAERKVLIDWLGDEARIERERRLTIATAIVLTSGPMRAFVSAINWVRRPSTPQKWMATQPEAVEWCCQLLGEAGIALPPAVGALRQPRAVQSIAARRSR